MRNVGVMRSTAEAHSNDSALAMIAIAALGNLPMIAGAEILAATTISAMAAIGSSTTATSRR